MFSRWREQRRRNREIVDMLYGAITQRARRPYLFEACGLDDTVMGRFEALSIAMFLFLRRCRRDAELAPIAQDVVDRFVADMDDSLRQIGIGDQSVPKRMRKLAGRFYERVDAYDKAFAAEPVAEALAEALPGRAVGEDVDPDIVGRLSREIVEEDRLLSQVPASTILAGRLMEIEE